MLSQVAENGNSVSSTTCSSQLLCVKDENEQENVFGIPLYLSLLQRAGCSQHSHTDAGSDSQMAPQELLLRFGCSSGLTQAVIFLHNSTVLYHLYNCNE